MPANEKPRNLAKSSPARRTSKMRRASRMSCSMMSRRRLRFCDLRRNSMAAQRTRLKRMRLIRWMMIGELMRAPPMTMFAGFKNSSYMGRGLHRGLECHAMVQEFGQHGVEIVAGADQGIVDAPANAATADLDQVFLQRFQIAVPQGTGVA